MTSSEVMLHHKHKLALHVCQECASCRHSSAFRVRACSACTRLEPAVPSTLQMLASACGGQQVSLIHFAANVTHQCRTMQPHVCTARPIAASKLGAAGAVLCPYNRPAPATVKPNIHKPSTCKHRCLTLPMTRLLPELIGYNYAGRIHCMLTSQHVLGNSSHAPAVLQHALACTCRTESSACADIDIAHAAAWPYCKAPAAR